MVRGNCEWKNQQRSEELPKARCYRCGRESPVNEMVEVGYEVYACPGGCRKAANTEETK
jgi:hypothetical protein